MKTIILNKQESNAFLVMIKLAELSKYCIDAETSTMNAFILHINRKPPKSDYGVVIKGKPQLRGRFMSETDTGWIAQIDCKEFRNYIKKAYNDTPEALLNAMPKKR